MLRSAPSSNWPGSVIAAGKWYWRKWTNLNCCRSSISPRRAHARPICACPAIRLTPNAPRRISLSATLRIPRVCYASSAIGGILATGFLRRLLGLLAALSGGLVFSTPLPSTKPRTASRWVNELISSKAWHHRDYATLQSARQAEQYPVSLPEGRMVRFCSLQSSADGVRRVLDFTFTATAIRAHLPTARRAIKR